MAADERQGSHDSLLAQIMYAEMTDRAFSDVGFLLLNQGTMSEDVARLLEIIYEAKEIVMRVEEQLEKIQCEQKLRKYDNILIGDLKLHSNETRILTCLCDLFDCNWYEVTHKTVADIIEYKPTDLLRVRNFGKGMLDALQDALLLEGVIWK